MAKYEAGDIVTYYFIIREDTYDKSNFIKGWTDSKELAEFYLRFHNSSKYRLKKLTNTIEEMHEIINENLHDEIGIANIYTRDRGKKSPSTKLIVIPITDTESRFLYDETRDFLSSIVNYSYLNESIPYLKNKYRDALMSTLLLNSVIKKILHNRLDKKNKDIEMDQLVLLYKLFPAEFG